ncbi:MULTISPECIES: acyltransferase [unclassified Novosphingobium]|uniref:acyltransferase family protein n=1 Tax=unclassified Novosphingobium TaxID=2644732 RepID=UPI00135A736B|nr:MULTISPECIES: acyltransferase [unclassified Novosphingobium]
MDGLDGLRGIAALCVFLTHVFPKVNSCAYLGVDFFFMLSGYVMARSYEAALLDPGMGEGERWAASRAFLGARVRRLCPTIFLCGLFGMPWVLMQPESVNPVYVAACLVFPWVLSLPVWSIGGELFANLTHSTVLVRLETRQLALLIVSLFAGLALLVVRDGSIGVMNGQTGWAAVALRTLVPYGAGIILYRTWRDVPPLAVGPVFTWAAMPVFIALASLLPEGRGLSDLVFVLVLCPLLIAGGLTNGRGSRLARGAGAFSFPLYAAHAPALLSLQAFGLGWEWQMVGGLCAGGLVWAISDRAGRRAHHSRRENRYLTARREAA